MYISPILGEDWSATFSPCERYRYTLIRRWSDEPLLNYICLNPSVATGEISDPTCTRLYNRAKKQWYKHPLGELRPVGGLIVTNLFSYRATNPKDMIAQDDPIGPDNDRVILEAANAAAMVVCGWGQHGSLGGRSSAVKALLSHLDLYALKVNGNGEPAHPLYLGYQLEAALWSTRHA